MSLTPRALARLRDYVRKASGIALAEDKAYLIEQRLESLPAAWHCRDLDELAERLDRYDSPRLRDQVVDAITTHETAFFRDRHPFLAVRDVLLPERLAALRARRATQPASRVRFWCAGVSTGQEAYSLGMTVLDHHERARQGAVRPDDVRILATDLSPAALAQAGTGRYEARDLDRGLTRDQAERWFRPTAEGFVVLDALRRTIDFARGNLIQPFTDPGPFDGIFCRNVLFYFDEATRRDVVERFRAVLRDDGFLCLGAAENLYGISDHFHPRRIAESVVYEKRPTA